jgi:PAS domain S-box-containing protein
MLNLVHLYPRSFYWIATFARTLFLILLLASLSVAQSNDPKRILILSQEDVSWPLFRSIDENIRSTLRSGLPAGTLIFSEHLDRVHFQNPIIQAQQIAWIQRKYANAKLDLVFGIGDIPEDVFPSVPLVYLGTGTQRTIPGRAPSDKETAVIWLELHVRKTLEIARQLQPQARQVVVIADPSPTRQNVIERVREQIDSDPGHMPVIYLTNLTFSEICERVAALGRESIVLFVTLVEDASGRQFIPADILPKIAAVSGAPIFALYETHIGLGAVGGYVARFDQIGKQAGEMGLQLLAGKHPADAVAQSGYLFDWRQLRRWNISESALPAGSVVINRQFTVWESYKYYILGAIFLGLAETLLILGLLRQRARKRKVEEKLLLTNDRLRSAMKSGKSVAWEWDVKSGQNSWFGDLKTMFGIESETHVGRPEDVKRYVHPDDQQQVSEAVAEARESRRPYAAEFRVVWPDRTVRWVAATGRSHYSTRGEPERMLGMAVDITERKLAEEALASMSQRLVEAQEQERSRIARELHDDTSQRLAMLAIGIEQLKNDLPEQAVELRGRASELRENTVEISKGVRIVAHELHSPNLEYLGLSLRQFCHEFGERQKVEVDFKTHDLPGPVPPDISLCLFRVLQEALHNSVKHSGAQKLEVELWGTSDEVHLSVSDSGAGFELEAARKDPGLGLISMQERVKFQKGTFSVESQPQRGTTIHVRLPLNW